MTNYKSVLLFGFIFSDFKDFLFVSRVNTEDSSTEYLRILEEVSAANGKHVVFDLRT